MAITNIFGAEQLILARIADLFPVNQVLVEENSADLDNEYFLNIPLESNRVAGLVLNAGYQADPPVGKNRSQRLKPLWQVVVVCPKSLYMTVGGVKVVEVMERLKGYRLAPEYDYMKMVSDERGFNRPDYIVDLVYIPSMFSVGTVI